MQIRDRLEHAYREIVYGESLQTAYPDYVRDAKILGQYYAKRERLETYQPSSDDLSSLRNSTKTQLDNAISKYESYFAENTYKKLGEQINKYNEMVDDYYQTHVSNIDTDEFPFFETYQSIKDRAKENEKIRLNLFDERNNIMLEYELFVRKSKQLGELEARYNIHRVKAEQLEERQNQGQVLTGGEQQQLNVINGAKKEAEEQKPHLQEAIKLLNDRILAYNNRTLKYNKRIADDNSGDSSEKKLLKLPDSLVWQNEAHLSIGKNPNDHSYMFDREPSEYERFPQYEEPSRSWFRLAEDES